MDVCPQDWAKPGPYDQPMVNTLRRKDKETPAAVDSSHSAPPPAPASMSTSAPPPAVLRAQSQGSPVEERSRPAAAPVQVSRSLILPERVGVLCGLHLPTLGPGYVSAVVLGTF